MQHIGAIGVFCGSKTGRAPAYAEAARALGAELARRGVKLVFGGGRNGLMGVVADAVLAGGGQAMGVIPGFLDQLEVGHDGLDEMIEVGSMHERKARMFAASDAFVVLPGGLGTLDEAFEVITWKQLRLHQKPIVLVDVAGYWSGFSGLIDGAVAGGFLHPQARDLFTVVARVEEVFAALENAPEPSREVLDSHM